MIYLEKPKEFEPRFEIISCFCECDGEILLLHRQDHKPEGGTWGVPAGKLNSKESLFSGILREIQEETGFFALEKDLLYFRKVFVKYPDYDFLYHIFSVSLPSKPKVVINPDEHKDFVWKDPRDALKINLIRVLMNV
ncbi:MAG: hypothetical protein COV70_04415 [Parcubacteria group bacterium CG11_big_fil_rev_8_21_14_0_20_39_22]|nr:MAG: hypothetical protein COV70_04415 [Parcubacteria group bacterium CG11_big_fil_rev_8_21_14_0_20_39_22]